MSADLPREITVLLPETGTISRGKREFRSATEGPDAVLSEVEWEAQKSTKKHQIIKIFSKICPKKRRFWVKTRLSATEAKKFALFGILLSTFCFLNRLNRRKT
jgi:hypothetical protein